MAASTKRASTFKPPKTLAECADLLYTLKKRRAEIVKSAKELQKDEAALKKYIIDTLPKSKAEGISGKLARVQIRVNTIPIVEDRKKLEAFIKKTGAFDLLRAGLNTKAVEERWAHKLTVPGVGTHSYKTVSLHGLKKK